MTLQEIFDQLSSGELSQLSMGGVNGEISEVEYPRMVNHINLALTGLYKRFHLKESDLILSLLVDQTDYPLTAPDLLKITQVFTEQLYELDLNNKDNVWAVNTPSNKRLSVPLDIVNQSADLPDELNTETLKVVYRANHPKIVRGASNLALLNTEIELPDSHLEALLLAVASRVHNPIGMTNEFHAGNSYAAKYEMVCQQLDKENLQVDQGSQNTRLARGGWV